MAQQPELTDKPQALMDFLNQLASTELTAEKLAEGNALLDAAAEECRREQDLLRQEQGDISDG
jgi:hypothetical protein